MTRASVFVIAIALTLGCSKSKQAKCEEGWEEMKSLYDTPNMDEAKRGFIAECQTLPDDAIECLTDLSKLMGHSECQKKLSGFTKIKMNRQTK
jgi:hypothetical protein